MGKFCTDYKNVKQKIPNDFEWCLKNFRKANLKNAFQLAADIVKYKKILLVDDIYTTGTTIDTVSEVLLKGGAERIYYICVSIGAGF